MPSAVLETSRVFSNWEDGERFNIGDSNLFPFVNSAAALWWGYMRKKIPNTYKKEQISHLSEKNDVKSEGCRTQSGIKKKVIKDTRETRRQRYNI